MENKINTITRQHQTFIKWKLQEGEQFSEKEIIFCKNNSRYFENIKFAKMKG